MRPQWTIYEPDKYSHIALDVSVPPSSKRSFLTGPIHAKKCPAPLDDPNDIHAKEGEGESDAYCGGSQHSTRRWIGLRKSWWKLLKVTTSLVINHRVTSVCASA